ncbi:lipoate--protein ligase family protein [Aerococcus sp. 1KP-2016]|uniref:lipoate--protein ligase family protein n=1 Tax=Aerococcus sp. 1KP-2016 TaxID=1981982 RepID=UPI000B98799A|nr:lipoate--protein ligase family protein [Aerococcus sp. 1KP-2016]OYQ67710.1 lipoate--protein ligase [Aerococcus sp. 1KP-2016]
MLFDSFLPSDQPLHMAVYQDIHHDSHPLSLADHDQLLTPFAVDDAILNAINRGQFDAPLALHFWPTSPTVILGGMDTRLPNLPDAVKHLYATSGIVPVVRPAGGLTVVSDPNVLNFTLLLDTKSKRLAIDDAYQLIVDLMQEAMDAHNIELTVGEIETSYCPGKFDVSIHGKKIAGIAQRRIGHAVGIYVYISISGDQAKRGQVVRDMYAAGRADLDDKGRYPQVDPDIMRNLSDFTAITSVQDFIDDFLTAFKVNGVMVENREITMIETNEYLERMQKRNQIVYDILARD